MKIINIGLRKVLPYACGALMVAIFTINVKADSTITIPVPRDMQDKQVTISLRIPPNTEPLNRDNINQPPLKANRLGVWNPNPSPKLDPNDELREVFKLYLSKGWIKNDVGRTIAKMDPLDKYYAIRLLQSLTSNVLTIGKAQNFNQVLKKCNLTGSDIEDLRRMIKRFEKDLIVFGSNPKNMDRDLLVIQEKFKASRQGILKVLKVEGVDDGSTLIHLSVD
jgi:hypothetical protein